MTRSILRDLSHLSEAKRALLAKRLKGRSDVSVQRGAPAPTALMRKPAKYHEPYPVRSFIAERLRYHRWGTSDFRMFIETRKSGLDPERFRRAWQVLYADCDVMRARVLGSQLVVSPPDGRYDIILRDARSLPVGEQQVLIDGTRERFATMASGAGNHAVEVALIRTSDRSFICFYSFDLLVLDLPSVEFLALRCRKIYEDRYEVKGSFHLQDYRRTEEAYLDSGDGRDAKRYWEKRIVQSGPRLSARHLTIGTNGQRGYGYLCRNIPRDIWEQGKARAKARGVSELVAVQVLFTDLLAHLCGRNSFAYEARSFQRLPFDPDIYQLLGQFTLGHLTGRGTNTPGRFLDRVQAVSNRMDRDAPFAFFDAASHWQVREDEADRGAKIVFTNTCNRFEEFVQAGNIPPMRWFGDYIAIRQHTPDTALEYVVVENDGDLENHWFLNHDHLPEAWANNVYNHYWDALFRLCTDDAAWDAPSLFFAKMRAKGMVRLLSAKEVRCMGRDLRAWFGRLCMAAVARSWKVSERMAFCSTRIRHAVKLSWIRWCSAGRPRQKQEYFSSLHSHDARCDLLPACGAMRYSRSGFKRVFLTGATGFFGSHLLGELLREGTEHVICHVRGGGLERVVSSLRAYGLWDEEWKGRISMLPGDLEQPELGLGPAFKRLAHEVDAVFHNGANVNYVLGFKQLRAANVAATQDALRIAEAADAPFFFISTLRMFDHRLDSVPIREDDTIDMSAAVQIGYAHSKVMSERLVTSAGLRGTKTAIFRLGLLCGDGLVGAPNQRDAVSLLIRCCVMLGVAPESPMQVNLTSVAYAAKGLVTLTLEPGGSGNTWHLVNDTPTSMIQVFHALIEMGYRINMIPYDAWVARLRKASELGATSLTPLLSYFTPDFPEETTHRLFDSTKTRRALAARGIRHPDIDDKYLAGNIRGMISCGFLPTPTRVDTTSEINPDGYCQSQKKVSYSGFRPARR